MWGQTAVDDYRGMVLVMIDCPGSEWVLKIGPIERQNSSGSREQSETGAKQMVLDAANAMLKTVLPLGPELVKGIVCSSGCGTPELAHAPCDCLRRDRFGNRWRLFLMAMARGESDLRCQGQSRCWSCSERTSRRRESADDRGLDHSLHRPQRTDMGPGSLLFRRFCARPVLRENPTNNGSGYLPARTPRRFWV